MYSTGRDKPPVFPLLQRLVSIKEEEVKALLWSWAYFFCLLCAYYIIRPLREEMGVAGGVWNIPWLYTGTLVAMVVAHPIFSLLVVKLPRTRFVTITYRFFMGCLVLFFILLKFSTEEQNIWIGRAFYIWTAVFSLYIVSIFWGFMSDIFHFSQGKRLFGFIGVGGTMGGIAGSTITAVLATRIGPVQLLIFSVILLEIGVQCVKKLAGYSNTMLSHHIDEEKDKFAGIVDEGTPIGGKLLAGISHSLRSPYLLGIAGYILCYTILSTFLYMQQADIADRLFTDRAIRTTFFAQIDLAVNVLTLIIQVFLTGRIIKALGIGLTLALVPILSIFGFAGLGFWPSVTIFVVFQVSRRAGNYAITKPTRETLFTVVEREDKYKAKNFIDTFVYRAGDQISVWAQWLLHFFGFSMAAIAFTAVPIAGLWLLVGLWLGRRQSEIAGLSRDSG